MEHLYKSVKVTIMKEKGKFWKKELKWFVVKHPKYINPKVEEDEEDIWTPRKDITIRFWIEGNIQIEGVHNELEINYNNPRLLILSFPSEDKKRSIIRVPWKRLIAFELFSTNDEENIEELLRIDPERSN